MIKRLWRIENNQIRWIIGGGGRPDWGERATRLPVSLSRGPDLPYSLPDSDVVSIIDAPPPPLASPSPGEQFVMLVHYQAHPPVVMLARRRLSLAGLRLDPAIGGRPRARRFTRPSVPRISDGPQRGLAPPAGAPGSGPASAPHRRPGALPRDQPHAHRVCAA